MQWRGVRRLSVYLSVCKLLRKSLLLAHKWPDRHQTFKRWTPGQHASRCAQGQGQGQRSCNTGTFLDSWNELLRHWRSGFKSRYSLAICWTGKWGKLVLFTHLTTALSTSCGVRFHRKMVPGGREPYALWHAMTSKKSVIHTLSLGGETTPACCTAFKMSRSKHRETLAFLCNYGVHFRGTKKSYLT